MAIRRAERAYGIPEHLLESIALVESGRCLEGQGVSPWPWTIATNGKGQYFSTKLEAIAAVKKLQARGVRNIDVGCMQVNLMHHPHAFKSLHEAFDISRNVAYAAQFLRDLREQYTSWHKAVGCYHSCTAALHFPYRQRVFGTWDKVRRQTPLDGLPPRIPFVFASASSRSSYAKRPSSLPSRSPAPTFSTKPMSAFYANLNRRSSGKLYQASLCRGRLAPMYR
jgi:hypothetical protein